MSASGRLGSNSPWSTDFRRDYIIADELHYDVDLGHGRWPYALSLVGPRSVPH